MKHLDLVDQAYQHLAMMNGISPDDRLRLLKIIEKMVTADWSEGVVEVARPFLNLVGGG